MAGCIAACAKHCPKCPLFAAAAATVSDVRLPCPPIPIIVSCPICQSPSMCHVPSVPVAFPFLRKSWHYALCLIAYPSSLLRFFGGP